MINTFDKLKIGELITLYERLLKKLNEYKPETQEYIMVEEKLRNMEEIIQRKKPSYFDTTDKEARLDNILENNYEVKDVAIMLNVSRQTIYNWINKNKINVIKVGRTPYIAKTEVERIVKDGI